MITPVRDLRDAGGYKFRKYFPSIAQRKAALGPLAMSTLFDRRLAQTHFCEGLERKSK